MGALVTLKASIYFLSTYAFTLYTCVSTSLGTLLFYAVVILAASSASYSSRTSGYLFIQVPVYLQDGNYVLMWDSGYLSNFLLTLYICLSGLGAFATLNADIQSPVHLSTSYISCCTCVISSHNLWLLHSPCLCYPESLCSQKSQFLLFFPCTCVHALGTIDTFPVLRPSVSLSTYCII